MCNGDWNAFVPWISYLFKSTTLKKPSLSSWSAHSALPQGIRLPCSIPPTCLLAEVLSRAEFPKATRLAWATADNTWLGQKDLRSLGLEKGRLVKEQKHFLDVLWSFPVLLDQKKTNTQLKTFKRPPESVRFAQLRSHFGDCQQLPGPSSIQDMSSTKK